MTQDRHALAFIIVATAFSAVLRAQEPPVAGEASAPLQVQVVISRYQGDKRVSSLPYYAVGQSRQPEDQLADGRATCQSRRRPWARRRAAKRRQPIPSYTYQSIGTNIDCTANPAAGNQYGSRSMIEDSSVYPEDQSRGAERRADVSLVQVEQHAPPQETVNQRN